MKKRNIALCIIFSIITFGIYGLYWFVHITNDVNTLANPEKKTSGGVALLLTIITCNIYGIYWAYKMGGLLDKAQTDREQSGTEPRRSVSDSGADLRPCCLDPDAKHDQFHD